MKSKQKNKNHLFRAYDIRGIYGTEIDALMMYNIGIAVGKVGHKEFETGLHVYVGYDIRQTSQLLAFSFISGLLSLGIKISFSNVSFPFGVVMYSGLHSKADFTAFITASHLPANWNGIKFYYGDGVGFPESKIIEIRDMYNKIEIEDLSYVNWNQIQSINMKEYYQEYISYLKENFSLKKNLRVCVDCGNGSASKSAPTIFKECNYDVITQWCDVDPSFPNRPSEPNNETLQVLCNKVKSDPDISFGIGFDGDGDRAVIVDNTGKIIPADSIAILLSRFLKNSVSTSEKPLILANIECSSSIEKSLKNDFEIKRIPVGHTFLTLEARENRKSCILGVESSGHFVFPQYFLFDDAVLLPLLVGKLLEEKNVNLSELIQEIPKMYSIRKTFVCSDLNKFSVMDRITSDLKLKYPNINLLDGISINIDKKGFVLIRASNTSPKIRIYVESDSESNLDLLFSFFEQKIMQKINEFD